MINPNFIRPTVFYHTEATLDSTYKRTVMDRLAHHVVYIRSAIYWLIAVAVAGTIPTGKDGNNKA